MLPKGALVEKWGENHKRKHEVKSKKKKKKKIKNSRSSRNGKEDEIKAWRSWLVKSFYLFFALSLVLRYFRRYPSSLVSCSAPGLRLEVGMGKLAWFSGTVCSAPLRWASATVWTGATS
ncbi:hypothetical protein CEXT_86931 [Caerostris extrusa]|uniref:Uncharacterized protein n=1 Tax=Caerostris extrusa TaxID=172846 RepID=A0AAV4SPZ5_CAEEX|nr:hypothetical protein CEXT_86931 [Caerostris extrusa]